jgi:hypothetical protein
MSVQSSEFKDILNWVRTPDAPFIHTVMVTFCKRTASGGVDPNFLVYGGSLDFRDSVYFPNKGPSIITFSSDVPELLAPGADLTFAPRAKMTISVPMFTNVGVEIFLAGGPNDGEFYQVSQTLSKMNSGDPGILDLTFGPSSEYFISLFQYRRFNRLYAGVSQTTTETKYHVF